MFRVFGVAVAALTAVCCAACPGQEVTPEAAQEGRVIGRIWHTRIDFGRSFEFMQQVREELDIPESPVMLMATSGRMGISTMGALSKSRLTPASGSPAESIEMKGTLIVLRTRPDIGIDSPVSFQLIGTADDFRNEVTRLSGQMGPAAELIGESDFYEIRLDFSKFATTTAGDAGRIKDADDDGKQQPTKSIAIIVTSRIDVNSPVPGGNQGPMPKIPTSASTYFRYVDGIMYSCSSNLLKRIELPTLDSLKLTAEESTEDLYADFDFTEVPTDLKRLFWSAVEAQAAVFLQRFDNEAEGDYSLRRALSEGRIELLKTILFDIDRARFSMNLPTSESKQITAKLQITARKASPLASTLSHLSNGGSQLGSLQDEQAPLLISSTFEMPKLLKPVASAFLDSVGMKLKQATSQIPAAESLIDDLIAPLQMSVTSGLMDSAICVRGSVETGLIPCAGFRLENAESFLGALQTFVQINGANANLHVSQDKIGDLEMFSLHAENARIPVAGSTIPVQIHFCANGSWVWLTVGGDSAVAMLRELVSNSNDHLNSSGQATPLHVRFRLDQWLGDTDDSISQLPGQVLAAAERYIGRATKPKMMISINGASVDPKEDTDAISASYATKVFHSDNSTFDFRIRTAEREIIADAIVGVGLVKLAVAQFLHAQSQMFKGVNFQFAPQGDGKGTGGTFRIQAGNPSP